MIKTLLSVRIRAFFASMIGKSKDGTYKKAGVGRIILISLLGIYLAAVFAFLAFGVAISLGLMLIPEGRGDIYYGVFMLITFSLIFIFSIFETKSEIFDCKDNDLLLSLPIKPGHIVASRVFIVMLYNYVECAVFMLPAIIVYGVLGGSPAGIFGGILIALLLPLLSTSLASAVGYLVALVSRRFKKNNFITVGISLLFMALYFVGYTAFMNGVTAMEEGTLDVGAMIESLSPFSLLGSAATLQPFATVLFAVLCIAAGAIAYAVISHSFIKIATDNRGAKRTVYKAKRLEKRSSVVSLVRKELSKFFSSAVYMLNTGIGLIFEIALAVLALVNKSEIVSMVTELTGELPASAVSDMLCNIAIAAMIFLCSTITISAPALSLEGKNLWILRSMPVRGRDVLISKTLSHIIISAPPTLITSVLLVIAVGAPPHYAVFMIITPQLVNAMTALLGTVLNTAFPKFNFENEAQPIKQSLSVFLSMIALMLFGIISVVISLILSLLSLGILAAVLIFGLTLGLCVLFLCLILGPLARRFEKF